MFTTVAQTAVIGYVAAHFFLTGQPGPILLYCCIMGALLHLQAFTIIAAVRVDGCCRRGLGQWRVEPASSVCWPAGQYLPALPTVKEPTAVPSVCSELQGVYA
jgi:hypothetical protein